MNARIDSLALIERSCWQELENAAAQRGHPWRTMALATTDGEAGHARMVILREVDAAQQRLIVYTDARSAKASQIATHPLGTLLAWSAELGWQLRLRCRFALDSGGLAASSRWARLKLTPAAQDYLSPLAPGSVLTPYDSPRAPREHFALVVASVEAIDWLELHADGHRRAAFDARGARWL
ncbi:MAG: pyridoxamine 5'-phosphate oxidase family protein [Rubrivivax sp.]|nr:pyridoxamine 5'-phosphate oxidase family protein [Rubrivivax sp.]